ncbi:hemicentin-1 isoform X2 [Chrysoperla carnea]|uniref:hemicentin-1 isoform X2 n=1 Tax=Chrysoperla carnea TaxID=189513 RepID=UPI001D05DE9C|nr:hemicentin-1 isoform X2 [Chrysoperla carnea]
MILFNDGFYLIRIFFILQLIKTAAFESSEDATNFYKHLPAQVVWAVLDKNVDLPCDVTPPTPQDSVAMVLWFKGESGIPLYSLDCRGGPIENGTHWATSDNLGTRSFFVTGTAPSKAHLHIRNIELSDEGIFRCRVDFFSSPTRNFRLNLTLVVPPSEPKIFDGQGHEVLNLAGPFLEGYDLFLSCQVKGGRPHPTLMWYEGDNILDGVIDTSIDSYTTVNQLTIRKVSRKMNNARFICKAQSSFDSPPITREVMVAVYLKPDYVKLILPSQLLSVQKTHLLKCETSGSFPPAIITWFLDGEPITNATSTKKQHGNVTISVLNLRVVISDDNKEIICRAANPHIPDGFVEEHKTLHVAYPPAVYIVAGPGIDSTSLHEGSEINLTCEAHANPKPHKYNWFHGDQLLQYNEVEGIIPVDKTLVLRKLGRQSSGEYRCDAVNSEGETRSVPFKIKVLYKPRCRPGYAIKEIGAFENNALIAHCEVEASPSIVKFYWTYNNSQGNFLPVQGSRTVSNGLVSLLYFTPSNEKDYGTLACWATNSVGNQEVPCYFHIKQARPPSPPQNCQIRYLEQISVEITCTPGEDGGITQRFSLEVLEDSAKLDFTHDRAVNDQATNLVSHSPRLFRVVENQPVFYLHNLDPGHEYKLVIHSINSRGLSDPPVVIDGVKIQQMLQKLEDTDISKFQNNIENVSPVADKEDIPKLYLIIISASILSIIIITTVVSILVCACKKTNNRQSDKGMDLAVVRRRREPSDDGGFGDSFRRHSEMFTRSASIEQSVPISRRISQHLVIEKYILT